MSQTFLPMEFKSPRRPHRLSGFLMAAALLHLCVMLLVPENLLVTTKPLGDLSLSFTSSTATPGTTQIERKQEWRDNQAGEQLRSRRDYLAPPSRTSHNGIASSDSDSARAAAEQSTQAGSDAQSIRRQLLGAITSSLSKHLVYPPVARQRGWQGEVRLSVDVNHTGELKNVQIARSSGHRLLDMSAKKALNDVRQVAMASDWQGRAYANMMIPVRYQLNDE
jgi:TonB family protein